MHNKDKYPELWVKFQELIKERDAFLEQVSPLRVEVEALDDELQPLLARRREAGEKLAAAERGRFIEVQNQIAALARAMR